MKRKSILFTCLMACFAFAFGQPKLVEKVTRKGNEIVIPYEKYVLPNGLTVVVHEDHSDPMVHVDVTYHVGSAREEIGKSGFAHFFEHMMFQGSDNVADEQHFKIVTNAGGTLNGTTNRDRTNYFETVPNNQLEKVLWLEADRMGFLLDAVTQKKFEIQRATVKNEKGQNYENVPYRGGIETYSKTLYPYGHPYSWLTIGYIEDLNRVDVNDLKNFFLRWYGPNNAVITIGGDVKTAEVLKMVEKFFGAIPPGPKVSPVVVPAVVIDKDRYVSYKDNYAKLPALTIGYPTVPNYNKDMAALACLAQVLGQGRNSVLYQQLVKKQLSVNANASSSLSELAGEFQFTIVPYPGKSLADMEKLFRAALDSFELRGITEDDVLKYKNGMEANIINGLQSVGGKVSQLASFQTFTGNPNKIAELLKMYQDLTPADVMAAYRKYIKGKGAVIMSVYPKTQESLVAAADNFKPDSSHYTPPDYGYAGLAYHKPQDNFNRSKMPGEGANPEIKVPAVWKTTLKNGAKVIGTESNELPVVTLTITIPGGHLAQANDISKAGLASFFSDMMTEDTKDHTAEQLSVELQKLGSNVNVTSSIDGITFSVQSLKKNIDATLKLLEERMLSPKFTENSFTRIKKQTLEGIKNQKADPSAVASAVFDKVNYGDKNILGISQDGTEETVKNLSIKDIEDYYNNYMTSVDAKVVVVGDIKRDEALAKLSFLDKLPKKKIKLPKPDASPQVDKTQVYIVDIPKAAQTEFRLGYTTGVTYSATGDYYKSTLANFALGGNFNSRLNLNLREDKGWTYGARSSFNADEYTGEFEFSAGIKANATDSALREVMTEMANYVLNGMSDDEVDYVKSAIGQRDALRFETGTQKATFIRRILDYDLPDNYTELQSKMLKNITKKELEKVAKQYIQPEKMNILVVGDKERIFDKVKALGYDMVELDADGNRKGEVVKAETAKFGNRETSIVKIVPIRNRNFTVQLMDNAEIDQDSVSLVFNGQVLLSKTPLAKKPVEVSLSLDKTAGNELIMFAENLGRIPPNTALIVVVDGANRYEITVTSDMKKNGTIKFIPAKE
jgi:zinc protease